MARDWFEDIGLTAGGVAEIKRRGLYDPMDIVCVRPRALYVSGVSDSDLRHIRAYLMQACERELIEHERNDLGYRPRVFLERMGWSECAIRDACDRVDEQRGTHVHVSVVAPEHEHAVRRMVERSSKRRHGHGESRKQFISR